MAESLSIEYETLVGCRETVVSEIAGDPRQMASALFQHRFISEDTKDKVDELNETKKQKARLLVGEIENKVKSYPKFYEKLLSILREVDSRYIDLVKKLQEKYTKIQSSKEAPVLELPETTNTDDNELKDFASGRSSYMIG